MLRLNRLAQADDWWRAEKPVRRGYPASTQMELAAAGIDVYDAMLIPPALRTFEFAEIVLNNQIFRAKRHELEMLPQMHAALQARLTTSDDPVRYHAILDEGALLRSFGGEESLEQRRLLVDLGELPNVTIQVIPFTAGLHPLFGQRIAILRFADHEDEELVLEPTGAGDMYMEFPDEVQRLRTDMDFLKTTALSPEESARLIMETKSSSLRKK
ncbi:hypothetical protein EV193_105204 [Herbihabitans rhizosphaerae]|uniref:DUF5753 domain-containing protein n=2 Tax=Herbihabitans rhizosphaerae TaxID=1872711 RepID=A0A4Q7KMV1_9PSEU|nr:hypothetical protein EV193_105204 [Herbihabitans rhizosphaerae]